MNHTGDTGAKILIVGADSLIGLRLCEQAGIVAVRTSRRAAHPEHVHLDLSAAGAADKLTGSFDGAILCAAITQHDRCAADPRAAYRVNVQAPAEIARTLMLRGTHVVFVSTDSVFGTSNRLRGERDPVQPGEHKYPSMKAQAEALLLETAREEGVIDRLAIVRLTKVLSARREPFSAWCGALQSGRRIEPLSDLLLAPISLNYAAEGLTRIALQRRAGILHLSGERDLSYSDVAQVLARAMRRSESVFPCSVRQAGVHPSYWPRYSSLSMVETQRIAGLRAQPVEQVIGDLLAEFHDLVPVQGGAACDIAA